MTQPAGWRARIGYFVVSGSVLVADQLTKLLAHHYLRDRAPVEVIPDFFNLWYSRNPGGLFGSFRDWSGPLRFALLTVLPIIAVVLIAGYLARTRAADRPTLIGLSLILGGAIGNLIDRVFRGEVIDFLDVYVTGSKLADWFVARFGTSHWPTFNVADSSIVVGACLLALSIVRPIPAAESVEPGTTTRQAGSMESL